MQNANLRRVGVGVCTRNQASIVCPRLSEVCAKQHGLEVINWKVNVWKIENIRKSRKDNINRDVLMLTADVNCKQCAFLKGL